MSPIGDYWGTVPEPEWYTTLTFEYDHGTPPPYWTAVPQSYGDDADDPDETDYTIGPHGGTPNVDVAYLTDDANSGILSWDNGDFNGTAVVGCSGDNGNWNFEFTPDAGHGVRIDSFDVVAYTGYTLDLSWQVVDANGVVLNGGAAQGTVTSDTEGIDANMPDYHTFGEKVILQITSVDNLYNGIDNIKFSQLLEADTDYDNDVDNLDSGALYGNFTGPGIPTILQGTDNADRADLIYDPNDGNVVLDATEASGAVITSYALENTDGLFEPNAVNFYNFDPNDPNSSTDTATAYQISQTDLDGDGFPNTWDLGDVFPTGMSLSELQDFLSFRQYCGTMGSGYVAFDLLRVADDPRTWEQGDFDGDGDVDNVDFGTLLANYTGPQAGGMDLQVTPEPATVTLLFLGGLGALQRRRRRQSGWR